MGKIKSPDEESYEELACIYSIFLKPAVSADTAADSNKRSDRRVDEYLVSIASVDVA